MSSMALTSSSRGSSLEVSSLSADLSLRFDLLTFSNPPFSSVRVCHPLRTNTSPPLETEFPPLRRRASCSSQEVRGESRRRKVAIWCAEGWRRTFPDCVWVDGTNDCAVGGRDDTNESEDVVRGDLEDDPLGEFVTRLVNAEAFPPHVGLSLMDASSSSSSCGSRTSEPSSMSSYAARVERICLRERTILKYITVRHERRSVYSH